MISNKFIANNSKGTFIPLLYNKPYFLGLFVSSQFLVGLLELTLTSQSLFLILVFLLVVDLVLLSWFLSIRSAGSIGVAGKFASGVVTVELLLTPAEPAPVVTPVLVETPASAANAEETKHSEPANKIASSVGLVDFIMILLKMTKLTLLKEEVPNVTDWYLKTNRLILKSL